MKNDVSAKTEILLERGKTEGLSALHMDSYDLFRHDLVLLAKLLLAFYRL